MMPVVIANAAPGTPNWVDLGIPDAARGQEFYTALFGWTYDNKGEEFGGYTIALKDGKPVAAVMAQMDPDQTESWWGVYFATDDARGSDKRIIDAGATHVAPPMEVGSLGVMALYTDPSGAQFGIWEGHDHIGAELVNEPGAICWNELVTNDTAAAAEFYGAALERPVEPMGQPGLDYITINVDGRPVAGIYGVPAAELAGSKPRWVTYFGVEDADEAARIATAQGGTVVREPTDSPFGRLVVLQDPFGTEFAAIAMTEAEPV
jgi:predicted enzyme related to lactoylglutathione lyase